MTTKDLANVNTATRKMILDYITKKDITLNSFATRAGVHQNQLWVYLYSGNDKKGLHSLTLEKIGKFMETNK